MVSIAYAPLSQSASSEYTHARSFSPRMVLVHLSIQLGTIVYSVIITQNPLAVPSNSSGTHTAHPGKMNLNNEEKNEAVKEP